MEKEKWGKVVQLCNVSRENKSLPPRNGLFSTKCPKCNSKLIKEVIKESFSTSEDDVKYINNLPNSSEILPGIYNLEIEHFTCKCGYEYVKSDINSLSEDF